MMYSEYIRQGGKGIIELLHDNQALTYLPSEAITPLDTAFNYENGSKQFTLPVLNLLKVSNDLTPIANMIKFRFASQWQPLYKAMLKDNADIATRLVQSTNDSKGNNSNQVAGYDSDTLVDDTATNLQNHTDGTVKIVDYSRLPALLHALKNSNYYDTMFADIRNYLFICIYGNERND